MPDASLTTTILILGPEVILRFRRDDGPEVEYAIGAEAAETVGNGLLRAAAGLKAKEAPR